MRDTLASGKVSTRQMMIIAGGKPELCCRRHAKREGGDYGRPYALHLRNLASFPGPAQLSVACK